MIPPALELPAWSFGNWVSASLRVERYYFISVHALVSWWPHLASSTVLQWLLLLNKIKYHPVLFIFLIRHVLVWAEVRQGQRVRFLIPLIYCLLTRKEQKDCEESSLQIQIGEDEDGAAWSSLHTTPPFRLSRSLWVSHRGCWKSAGDGILQFGIWIRSHITVTGPFEFETG